MSFSNLRDDPVFKAGLLMGAAMTHAQKHVEENFSQEPDYVKHSELERMTTLIINELMSKRQLG